MLESMLEARHGGALVILPESKVSREFVAQQYHIHCKYGAPLPLGVRLAAFLSHCADMNLAHEPGEHRALAERWNLAWHQLTSRVQAVAQMANVDGCVVLDADLTVVGFGGEIRVDRPATPLPLVDAATQTRLRSGDIEAFGTRHRSACRLCQARPGMLAFVVSQDSELRIFASDEQQAYRYDTLDA